MTVRELLDRIDSRELTEWFAFYKAESSDMKEAQIKAKQQAHIGGQLRGRGRKG